MAYRFLASDASVEAGLRRIAGEQIDKALATLRDGTEAEEEKVHDLRKRCKKLRGLIRIVRPSFPAYQEENAFFRDLARSLSDLRDAKVMQDCYDRICNAYDDALDRSELGSVRRNLTARRDDIRERQSLQARLADAESALTDARERAKSWSLDGSGWDVLTGGLAKTYSRGVSAMEKAEENAEPRRLHEWRKRTKYHWYHMRLLEEVWPPMMSERADQAHALSDDLGDHHDLALFVDLLTEDAGRYGPVEKVDVLTGLAGKLMARLERTALDLGPKLYAETEDDLLARIGSYWESWREGAPDRKLAATG
ncbi:hypothetical protein B5C34_07530 [Pacificimonas flava]|uniref:CHAD domain-containing protein n=2 Tax=Pacificimonas TaxID=1960290 RepID=A0A219B4J4_9SPHN|nr:MULTISPECIES: CHAD domain-containing protein [Pacificimonas]MBZ6379489.1 CHAD domain-containing protein [Pacificimonas aurantium]OWV33320.1 hypothetical protein B5C34_07530 [Pacificimonas flava]